VLWVCVCVRESERGELSQDFGGATSPSCPENRLGPYIIHSLQPIHSILPSSSRSLALFSLTFLCTHLNTHQSEGSIGSASQPSHSPAVPALQLFSCLVQLAALGGIGTACHHEWRTKPLPLLERNRQLVGWHLVTMASPWQRHPPRARTQGHAQTHFNTHI